MIEHRKGATYFVTLECFLHHPLLTPVALKRAFIAALQETRKQFGLHVGAYVILDDHAHLVFVASGEGDFHGPMNYLRARFVRAWRDHEQSPDHALFWEHGVKGRLLEDDDQLRWHLDFVHYDPVRHGVCERASDYPWSSLPARVEQGHYAEDWAVIGPPAAISHVLTMNRQAVRASHQSPEQHFPGPQRYPT